jgi:hypothetical protein
LCGRAPPGKPCHFFKFFDSQKKIFQSNGNSDTNDIKGKKSAEGFLYYYD